MAVVDPDIAARLAKTVQDIYAQATADLLSQVAARLARGIGDPGWAEQKLLEVAGLRDDAQQVIAELERNGPPAVRKAIIEARSAGVDNVGLIATLTPATNTLAVEALARETVTKLQSAHLGILRQVDDTYRQIVAEVAAPGVVTGSITVRQAAQRALNAWADRGIDGFVDSAGRHWELASYAEMATRTSTARAMVGGRLEGYVADGREFVIVSDAPAECSLCRPFEGKGLSISGAGVGATYGGIRIIDTVDGAQTKGLFHPNCRHDLRPIIPGLTEPMTHTADPEGDDLRREQRRLERGVRKWRQRHAVALDDNTARGAALKVKEWRARLKTHVDSNGLKRLPYREGLRLGGVTATPTTQGIRTLIPRASVQGRKVVRALDAIQKVHTIPGSLRGITFFDGSAMTSVRRGFYRTRSKSIALNTGRHVEATAVHEMGHAIEHRLFGLGNALTDPRLGPTIESTPEVLKLHALAASGQLTPRDLQHVAYLLDPAELWARSYMQWVATRSGSVELGQAVNRVKGLSNVSIDRYRQWDDVAFDPIARAFDQIFRERGLL